MKNRDTSEDTTCKMYFSIYYTSENIAEETESITKVISRYDNVNRQVVRKNNGLLQHTT